MERWSRILAKTRIVIAMTASIAVLTAGILFITSIRSGALTDMGVPTHESKDSMPVPAAGPQVQQKGSDKAGDTNSGADSHRGSDSDAFTARMLEQQTGIPAAVFLEDRKAGKPWKEIIKDRAKGVEPARELPTNSTPAIDEEHIQPLIEQGFARQDVLNAASIARAYKTTTEAILALKTPERSWAEVRSLALARTFVQDRRPTTVDDVMQGEERSSSGLNREQVSRLLQAGYDATEVITADALATIYKARVDDLLAQRKQGKQWKEIVGSQAQTSVESSQGRIVPPSHPIYQSQRLSDEQLRHYQEQGVTTADLQRAVGEAIEYNQTLDEVLDAFVSTGRNWDAVREHTKKPAPQGDATQERGAR